MASENDAPDTQQKKLNITEQVLDEAAIKQAIEDNQPKKPGVFRTVFLDFGRKTHWSSMKLGFGPHLSNIKSMLSPICPQCGKSILMHDNRIPRSFKGNVNWSCGNPICTFEMVAPNNFNKLKKQIADTQYPIAQKRLSQLSETEKENLIKNHFFTAKLYLCLTILASIYAIYMMFKASHIILMIPGILLISLFYLWSIKSAFRAWQIRTGLLFLPNSPFLAWYRYAPAKYNLKWYDGENPLPIETLEHLAAQKNHLINDLTHDKK